MYLERAAGTASGYLVNFVQRGDPNGPGLPTWSSYGRQRPAMLDLDPNGDAVPRSGR